MAVAYWETVGCNVAVYSLGTGHQAMDQHEVEVLLRRFPTREMRKMMIAMQMEEPEEIDTISEGKLRHKPKQTASVALELMRDRAAKLRAHSILRRASLQGLRKLCILSGDALQMLRHLVPSTSVSHVFVNFPEPPFVSGEVAESTYHMMTSELFEEMHRVLQKGCQITILSDNHRYMQSLAQTAGSLVERGLFCSVDHPGEKQMFHQVALHHGWPDKESGHLVKSSSYFDSHWAKGHRVDRFYISLRKTSKKRGADV
ncbi:unnamed protein product [Durusdinium trenchii]|uniref:tRNA (guanine(46)-N(7))-methyltransferase n=1 Tax=Durusdinium trenchii TaxID=1381693 RepID=A0ABP0IIN0_9DINO